MRIGSSCARTGAWSASIGGVFGRGQMVFDPWHYVPVLARKPGAWRNGAPFKDWLLRGARGRVRRKLTGVGDGDEANGGHPDRGAERWLAGGGGSLHRAREEVHSADVVLNILARQRERISVTILAPEALRLRHEPVADYRPL